jgi:hypothetical protein
MTLLAKDDFVLSSLLSESIMNADVCFSRGDGSDGPWLQQAVVPLFYINHETISQNYQYLSYLLSITIVYHPADRT